MDDNDTAMDASGMNCADAGDHTRNLAAYGQELCEDPEFGGSFAAHTEHTQCIVLSLVMHAPQCASAESLSA